MASSRTAERTGTLGNVSVCHARVVEVDHERGGGREEGYTLYIGMEGARKQHFFRN